MAKMLTEWTLVLVFSLLAGVLQNATAEETPDADMSHPRDAALVKKPDGGWAYVKFPEGSRLYVHEDDTPGQSNCNLGCAAAWPPLLVTPGADRVGAWTAIQRDDGKRQWAYKGQAVYYRFHDLPLSADQLKESGFRILDP